MTTPIPIFLVAVLLRVNLSLSKSWTLVVILLCKESLRIMASFGPVPSRSRDALQSAIARLYKYALVLTVNEEFARALLRSTTKTLNLRKDFAWDDRDHLVDAFRRMHAMWSAKLAEDPNIQKRCQPEPRLFAGKLSERTACRQHSFREICRKHVLAAESCPLPRLRRGHVLRRSCRSYRARYAVADETSGAWPCCFVPLARSARIER